MKKSMIAAMLAAMMVFGAAAFAQVNETDGITVTAAENNDVIKSAVAAGIMEEADYNGAEAITREQFCEAVYNTINPISELPVAKLARAPFDDTSNIKINALAFVKIVSGKAEYVFAPEDKLTREEAAAILFRAAEYAGAEIPEVKVDMSYSDNSEISDWAISQVYGLKVLGIMENGSDNKFNPQAEYTVAETAQSLLNLQNLLKK